jgi:hypothetical protein
VVTVRTRREDPVQTPQCEDRVVITSNSESASRRTRVAAVLRPAADRCEVSFSSGPEVVEYAEPFRPRAASLTPGHLVAVTTSDSRAVIIWRWFDAVVLEQSAEGVRLWEPAHGEVLAQPRDAGTRYPPGARAYLSAGLPGADWWVEGIVGSVEDAGVQLDPVLAFYEEHGLWSGLG